MKWSNSIEKINVNDHDVHQVHADVYARLMCVDAGDYASQMACRDAYGCDARHHDYEHVRVHAHRDCGYVHVVR